MTAANRALVLDGPLAGRMVYAQSGQISLPTFADSTEPHVLHTLDVHCSGGVMQYLFWVPSREQETGTAWIIGRLYAGFNPQTARPH